MHAVCAFRSGRAFRVHAGDTARISPKDVMNECQLFIARTSWERETSSAASNAPAEPSGARKAFDDLFKF